MYSYFFQLQEVREGVSCYGRHFIISHVLFTSTESNIMNDQSSDVHFHNVGAKYKYT